MRRHWLLVLLCVAGMACASLAIWQRSRGTLPPERPFADLSVVLSQEVPRGWELHIAPAEPGPYRLLLGGAMLGNGEGTGLTCRVVDDDGAVLEELSLRGTCEYDQLVVYLETPGGRRTLATLKRML